MILEEPSLACGATVIYDSGAGGLWLFEELLRRGYGEKLVAFCDSAFFPYGKKSVQELSARSSYILDRLAFGGAKQVIVACHTLSTQLQWPKAFGKMALHTMLEASERLLLDQEAKEKVALLATEGTLRSGVYQTIVKRKWPKTKLFEIPATALIEAIEKKFSKEQLLDLFVKTLPKGFKGEVFLGSTHLSRLAPLLSCQDQYKLLDPIEKFLQLLPVDVI